MLNGIEIKSPIDDKIIGYVKKMSKEDVDFAYKNARKAFLDWKSLSTAERAQILKKVPIYLEEMKEELAKMLTLEVAKSYKDSLNEIERTIYLINYTIEEGMRVFGEVFEGQNYSKEANGKISIVKKEPLGVVLAISPYNYPINLSASKIMPALITGNVVIFKPPTQGALSSLLFMEAFKKAKLPEGVLTCITGKGSEIGDYLNTHKEIDFINFTGSTKVGERIGEQAKMKPILLELGGKDAAIVLKDADLKKAAKEIISGAFSYSAQRCTAIKRVLVEKEVKDKLVELLLENIKKLKVGNPFDNVDIVPLIDNYSADFIESLYKDAILKGAKCLTTFKREKNLVYPILLDEVSLDMKIAWEEPFGPILPIINVENIDEAIKISNDSEYGLQSSVFTKDIEKAFYVASRLEVGTVHINNKTQRGPDNFPFLGIKNSGVGVQGIRNSILSMMKTKTIVLDIK